MKIPSSSGIQSSVIWTKKRIKWLAFNNPVINEGKRNKKNSKQRVLLMKWLIVRTKHVVNKTWWKCRLNGQNVFGRMIYIIVTIFFSFCPFGSILFSSGTFFVMLFVWLFLKNYFISSCLKNHHHSQFNALTFLKCWFSHQTIRIYQCNKFVNCQNKYFLQIAFV